MFNIKNQDFQNLRLQSLKDGILRMGPQKVQFRIVNACNFNCVFCWHHSSFKTKPRSEEWKRQKIDTRLFINTVKDLAELGCENITFSGGGEPFCHPDIVKLIKAVKRYKLFLSIFTNLSFVKDINGLIKLGVNQIYLNMNAATPETYLAMHPNQKKEMFHVILDRVQRLSCFMIIDLVFLINKLNYFEIEKFIRLASQLKVGLRFDIMHYYAEDDKIAENLCIDNTIKKDILSRIAHYQELSNKLHVRNNLDLIKIRLLSQGYYIPIEKFGCFQVGYFESYISTEGMVHFCCMGWGDDFLVAGDLRRAAFRKIWFSDRYEEIRGRLRRKKFLKICNSCSEWLSVLSNSRLVSPLLNPKKKIN